MSSLTAAGASPTYLITVEQIVAILRARWLTIAVVLAVVLAGGFAAAQLSSERYTASATVLVDVKAPDPISGLMMQGVMLPSYMNTQVDLIRSEPMARRVVRELRLHEDPGLRAQWQESTGGVGDIEAWLAGSISAGLSVTPSRDSNLFEISYSAANAEVAAAAANAYVRAYIDTNLQLRVDPARQNKTFFEDTARRAREVLEEAQQKLSQFQRQNGLLNTGTQVDVETIRLNELTAQLVQMQAQAADTQSRRLQSAGASDQTQEALSSGLIISLRADLQRARARLNELRSNLGDAHPQIAQLRESIAETERRIQEETSRVTGGIAVSDNVNQRRLSELQSAISAQRAKVAQFKLLNDESIALRRDVENAQRSYDSILSRSNQVSLESQTAQTNVSVIGQATVPSAPSSPNKARIMVAALLVGLFLGVCVALFREYRDPRLRTDGEVLGLLRQPLIVSLPRFKTPNGPSPVRRLVTRR